MEARRRQISVILSYGPADGYNTSISSDKDVRRKTGMEQELF